MDKHGEIDNKAIGQRIREEREKLKLSREEFAEIVGLSDYYVGQLERGERQMSLPVLVKVCKCLHISSDYLLWGKTSMNPPHVHEGRTTYAPLMPHHDIAALLTKCSPQDLELFKKLIITILPYLGRN